MDSPSLLKPCLLLSLLTGQTPIIELKLEKNIELYCATTNHTTETRERLNCIVHITIIRKKKKKTETSIKGTNLLLLHRQIIHTFNKKFHIPLHKWIS